MEWKTALVLTQSFCGITPIGLFYGWAALSQPIATVFNPHDPYSFGNQHGLFVGVLVLFLSACPLLSILHVFITHYKLFSEFAVHAAGLVFCVLGLCFGCLALEFKILWLWYVGCGLFCGLGELCIFRRVLFQHQIYFKSINRAKFGGGIFGFFIGAWTIIFFLIAEPLLSIFSVGSTLAIYALIIIPAVSYPLFTINDEPQAPKKEGNAVTCTDEIALELSTLVPTVNAPNPEQEDEEEKEKEKVEVEVGVEVEKKEKEEGEVEVEEEEKELTLSQLFYIPQSYLLTVFFAVVLTPGWGIKLASFFILRTLFGVSIHFAEAATLVYMTSYAFGRLFAGLIAERIGVRTTYNVFIGIMIILLFALPTISQDPNNKLLFVVLLCLVGLLYGGCKALFYSVVFSIFGVRHYRVAFSFAHNGFALAVVTGGLSSAFSFSDTASVQTGHAWFYAMGGMCLLALALLFYTRPIASKYTSLSLQQ